MSMVKHKNFSRILVAILAVITVLAYSMPASVAFAATPFPDSVPSSQVEYRHNGGHDYEVKDPDWVRVYCLDPAKGYSDSHKNQNFRWKADLKNNAWLLNSNQTDVNGSNKPSADHINRLVSILWYAQQMNANIKDTQDAVWWFVTNGAVDNYKDNLSKYNNYIVLAAGDSGWAVPDNYELYLYAPDNAAYSFATLQNSVRLVTDTKPDNPPTPPEEPKWEISTTAYTPSQIYGEQTATSDKPITIQLKPGETKSQKFDLIETIHYSNMAGAAGHKVWFMLRLMKVNSEGEGEEIANRGTQPKGDIFYMGEGNPWHVDASGSGTWENDSGGQLTFYERQLEPGTYYLAVEVYDPETGVKMDHNDPTDKAEMIIVKPAEEEPTTEKKPVKISKKALGGAEVEGAQIVVKKGTTEVEKWTSTKTAHEFTVEPGEYTMTETVAPKGYKQVTTEIKFTVAADGKVTLGTTTVNNGGKISVQDSNHIILEDAPEDTPTPTPTPKEGSIKTTVTAGGKTASATAAVELTAEEASKVTSITDKIDYEGLVGGATYSVQGRLMDVTDATKPTEVARSAAKECKADASGKGSWEIEFTNIQLEAGRTFVVFESATRTTDANGKAITGGETLTHEDANDKAQTIIVEEEYESSLTATKTTDVKTATVGDVIPFTISIANDGNGDAKDVKVTDYLGKNLKYVSDSNGGNNVGQNVHWTVDVPAGETVEIDIDCEVSEDAAGKIVNKVYVFDSTKANAEPVEYEDEATVAFTAPDNDSSDEDSDSKSKASNPTKVSTLARTSDEFNLGMWAVLMAISAFGLAAAAMRRRYER